MKTVYVLGAGASIASERMPPMYFNKSLRMPSGTRFFRDVFAITDEEGKPSPNGPLNFLGATFSKTTEFLEELLGMPEALPEDWDEVNIEDVFSIVDVAVSSLPKNTGEHQVLKHVRSNLLHFIDMMIWVRCEGQYCARLGRVLKYIDPQDTLISFNWDTLADVTLDILDLPQFRSYISVMNDGFSDHWRGTLLKLHGSVNWISCGNLRCRERHRIFMAHDLNAAPGHRLLPRTDHPRCPVCGCPQEVALIPPTSRKLIDRGSRFHALWMEAREQLARADKVVIVGYSLPRTDVHAEWLFRELNLLRDKHLEVEVVDPDTEMKQSAVLRRFESVFHKFGVARTFPGFESYAAQAELVTGPNRNM